MTRPIFRHVNRKPTAEMLHDSNVVNSAAHNIIQPMTIARVPQETRGRQQDQIVSFRLLEWAKVTLPRALGTRVHAFDT